MKNIQKWRISLILFTTTLSVCIGQDTLKNGIGIRLKMDSVAVVGISIVPKVDSAAFVGIPTIRKVDSSLVQFLGLSVVKLLTDTDSIQCYLLDPSDTTPQIAKFGAYPIFQKGELLSFRQQEMLTNVVLTTLNYGLDSIRKNCIFNPGIGFEFYHEKDAVQLLICLDCDEWRWLYGNTLPRHEDCDKARPSLIQLCRQLFPKDKIIQSLK